MKYRLTIKEKKALNRTGKLFCQICKKQEILIRHHIAGRQIPHYNRPNNIVNVCDSCHRKIHSGIIIVEGYFLTTTGTDLLWHEKEQESFTGQDIIPYIIPDS